MPIPTLSVEVVSLIVVPSSVQPAAEDNDPQESVPEPLLDKTVSDEP